MKALIILLATLGLHAGAQTAVKTQTFVVKGNCVECKDRIENAGDIKGVKLLKWNVETKVASATFDTTKVSLINIQDAILKAGHDVGDRKADDKAYRKLPKCCRFRDGACKE